MQLRIYDSIGNLVGWDCGVLVQGRRTNHLDKLCHDFHLSFMATMNISLPDPMKSWVEARSKTGRFSNSSDYVRDLIRRDQERQMAVAELQGLIDQGLESGAAETFNMGQFIASKRKD